MFAIDDGIWHGNLDFADVCFLAALIVAVVAAILSIPRLRSTAAVWAAFFGWIAVALISLGWLVL